MARAPRSFSFEEQDQSCPGRMTQRKESRAVDLTPGTGIPGGRTGRYAQVRRTARAPRGMSCTREL